MKSVSRLFTWRSAIAESDLDSSSKLVAFVLSLHMSELGDSAWPSLDRIVRLSSLSKATVARCLKRLDEGGWLHRKRSTDGVSTTVYSARIPKSDLSHGETGAVSQRDVSLSHGETQPRPMTTTEPTELRSERKRALSLSEEFADEQLLRLQKLLSQGKGHELSTSMSKLYRQAWEIAYEEPELNAKTVGMRIVAAYVNAVTDGDPDFGRIGRLVGQYGALALDGLAEALQKPSSYHKDVIDCSKSELQHSVDCDKHDRCRVITSDPYTYAHVVCKQLMREHAIEQGRDT